MRSLATLQFVRKIFEDLGYNLKYIDTAKSKKLNEIMMMAAG
jgi:hypothetical protein